MPDLNKERLIKLLKLTNSPHDGEALSASRHANALLRDAQSSWEQILVAQQETFGSTAATPPQSDSRSNAHEERPIVPPRPKPPKDTARGRVRSVPFALRLIFFPAWLTAETYITACVGERWSVKAVAVVAPLAIGTLSSVLWVSILNSVWSRI